MVRKRGVIIKGLTVDDFERFEEQLVQTEQSDRIIHIKSQQECFHKIGSFLQVRHVSSFFTVAEFDVSCPCVESDLQFQVLDERFEDLDPVFPQRRVSMGRNRDSPHFARCLLVP